MKQIITKMSQIKPSGIRHEVLPEGFIIRAQRCRDILEEVNDFSLEEFISDFQRDWSPEVELLIWENITLQYHEYVRDNPDLTIQEKKEVYKELILDSFRPK